MIGQDMLLTSQTQAIHKQSIADKLCKERKGNKRHNKINKGLFWFFALNPKTPNL
jgi:hypothetical protein